MLVGNPGNSGGSGRPPNELRAALRSLVSSDEALGEFAAVLRDRHHPRFVEAMRLALERGYGKDDEAIPVADVRERLRASLDVVRRLAPVDLADEIIEGMRAAWR